MKCPKCGSDIKIIDTDYWSSYECINQNCSFSHFEEYEEDED